MIIFLTIFLSFISFAQDCTDVNLLTPPTAPFRKIPVYDQNGSGMCYAYGAAQLMNHELLRTGAASELTVHPAWAGMNYGRSSGDLDLRGGDLKKTVASVERAGNCNYQSVTTAIAGWASRVGVKESRILSFIDDYGRILRASLSSGHEDNEATRRAALLRAGNENLTECTISDWQKIFGSAEFLATNAIDVTSRLMSRSCDNLSRVTLPALQDSFKGSDQEMGSRINSVLSQGKPLAMTFCSWAADRRQGATPLRNVFVRPDGYRGYRDSSSDVCGAHVAIIAGQRLFGNSCHLLYRNSRGNRWYKDNRHLTCLCKDTSTGRFINECRFETHNKPNLSVEACWVPKDLLVSNILGVNHY